ncbi:MAG TPA: alkaline phosphatase [Candidatus Cryosericum sp.]|nr:alkaline phosphatase [Candidatus Cryosericum sp.]
MRIKKTFKQILSVLVLLTLAFALCALLGCAKNGTSDGGTDPAILYVTTKEPAASPEATPTVSPVPVPQLKYIFLFIGDGMSTPQIQAASEALAAENRPPLSFVSFPVCGYAHTNNVENEVTDSAAAATAISSGVKTTNGYLGLDPSGNRLTSIAELLRDAGRKIGILTTVSLDHATPAGFYAHVDSRRTYTDIADDLFASGFDFFAGGGFHDTPDAAEHALENGYSLVSSPAQAPADLSQKLIVSSNLIFGDYGVLPAIDGGERTHFLSDVTALAINRLTTPQGFYMMVEGGRIDYFCHYNDAGSFVAELLDFDEAVSAAIALYEAHPTETLILVTGDHETGKVSLVEGDRTALLKQTISSDKCDDTLVVDCVAAQTPFETALPLFAEAFGLDNLTAEETEYLKTAYTHTLKGDLPHDKSNEEYGVYEPITSACARLVAQRAGLVFGSGSHSDLDVPVFALGVGQELFAGEYENTYLHDGILQAIALYPILDAQS